MRLVVSIIIYVMCLPAWAGITPTAEVLQSTKIASDNTEAIHTMLSGVEKYETFGRTPYRMEVTRVIDGDTFEGNIFLWKNIIQKTIVRVRGYDSPEKSPKKKWNLTEQGREAEKDAAEDATDAAMSLLLNGPIWIIPTGEETFGREVCDVFIIHDWGYLVEFKDVMIRNGHIKKKEWDVRIK